MTIFVVVCVAMVVASLALIARPLMRGVSGLRTALLVVATILPLVAVGLYWAVGHRTWQRDEAATREQVEAQREVIAEIAKLEEALRAAPDNVAAALNLGEALVARDERTLAGRAGELFEFAVTRQPDNMKALWYGAMAALVKGKLPLARERLVHMKAQNPPPQIQTILERQIQDIDQQLNEAQRAPAGRALNVSVALAPNLKSSVDASTPLFVLARDPAGGPPLAAVRRSAGDLPLSITLSESDAMIRGRGIGSVSRVEVVARISKSGSPQAQAGDLFGSVEVEFKDANPVAVKIVIDRKVEK